MQFFGLAVFLVLLYNLYLGHKQKKREAMLAAMTETERCAFLEKERLQAEALKARQDAQEQRRDAVAAQDAVRLIEVARAEGRKSARVWVRKGDVAAVQRWGGRNGYRVLIAKPDGRDGDVQLSFTWPAAK